MVNSSFAINNRVCTVSARSVLYYVFLASVFFPYLQLIPTGTDMQPFAMLSSVLLFFFFDKKLYITEVWLLYMLFSAFILLIIDSVTFTGIRSFVNYVSLFFISYVAFRVLRTGRVDFKRFFLISFGIWFSVSLIQKVFDSNFLTFLISSSRTTADRGVTGLAPEPTFLGIVFLFYMIFALHMPKLKFRKALILMSTVGILLLASSSMVFLFLVLMLGVFFLTHINFKSLVLFLLSFIFFYYLVSLLEGSRIYRLIEVFKNDPSSLLLLDASINDRFFHVFFSVKGFFENYLIPNGYYSWLPYVEGQLIAYKDVVIVEWFSLGGRIMSGYGGAFFELGIFFITVPLVLVSLLYRLYRHDLKQFFFFSVFVNMIMFSAIPIGFPMFAFYFGFLSFLVYEKERKVLL